MNTSVVTQNSMHHRQDQIDVVCNPLVFVLVGHDLLLLQRSSLLLVLHHMMIVFQVR